MEAEGKHPCVYTNDKGDRSVCYGFNLETDEAAREILSVAADFDSVISGDECLDESQCNILLWSHAGVGRGIQERTYKHICRCGSFAIRDIIYDAGIDEMNTWTEFNSAVDAKDWEAAADDLLATPWCSKVGDRCKIDAEQIRSCGKGWFNLEVSSVGLDLINN